MSATVPVKLTAAVPLPPVLIVRPLTPESVSVPLVTLRPTVSMLESGSLTEMTLSPPLKIRPTSSSVDCDVGAVIFGPLPNVSIPVNATSFSLPEKVTAPFDALVAVAIVAPPDRSRVRLSPGAVVGSSPLTVKSTLLLGVTVMSSEPVPLLTVAVSNSVPVRKVALPAVT